VQQIADGLQLFDRVRGSDGHLNLAGAHKLAAVRADIGDAFVYAGDSSKDHPLWAFCRKAILCGDSEAQRRRLPPEVDVVGMFPATRITPRLWVRALRLHQWAKNMLLFVPLLLSGIPNIQRNLVPTMIAFVALGCLASATYLINDLLDLPADRMHRSKKRRPLAAGDLPLQLGVAAVPLLLAASAALIAVTGVPLFALVAGIYTFVTLSYSLGLKRQPILDLVILAGLFTIRVWGGMVAAHTMISPWLLTFSMFFFASLATVKRYTECAAMAAEGRDRIPGRGYRAADAMALLAMGAGSGYSAVLVFFIYLVNAVAQFHQFQHPYWLWPVCPVLAYWLSRVWLLAARGEMQDDPIAFALRDRLSIVLALTVVASVCLAMS
jgi:4-hydroxybenzoate polyprenyltransferase